MILFAVISGALIGYLFDAEFLSKAPALIEPIIYLLILTSGIGVGYNLNGKKFDKHLLLDMIAVPFFSATGTVLGGILFGGLLGYNFWQAGMISSGMGWYSLSAVMISQYDSMLAATALMVNVFREMLAIIFTPYVARYIGFLEAVAPGGATTMDTTLPVISSNTDANTTVVAFTSAIVLMVLVPVLVELFINIGYR